MHIILYVMDALRADHLGCYGYDRVVSPNIDQLAANGVLFENGFTSTTWTRPVAASLLTGVYPGAHKTRTRKEKFSTSFPRLSEILQMAGFKTAAFSTMGNLASDLGFKKGFDNYFDLFCDDKILAKRQKLDAVNEGLLHDSNMKIALPRAEDINEYLFAWLNGCINQNTFSFIWSIETHAPYNAPDKFRKYSGSSNRRNEGTRQDIRGAGKDDKQLLIDLYDDEIFYNDFCFGQVLDFLREREIFDETLIILISDHGDAFWEHGVYGHGHTPYDEIIHVPMVMKFPQNQYAGMRINKLVELIDIYPTIIATLGLDTTNSSENVFQGYDLMRLIKGDQTDWRKYVFSDTQILDIHNRYLSARDEQFKYIKVISPNRDSGTLLDTLGYVINNRLYLELFLNPRHFLKNYFKKQNEYLFDLKNDPMEQNNIAKEQPELIERFFKTLDEFRKQNEKLALQVTSSSENYQESELLKEHLAKLGYL